MKSVPSVARSLTTMMMMMMMAAVVFVSAAPLPSSVSRRDKLNGKMLHLPRDEERNATSFLSHQDVNRTLQLTGYNDTRPLSDASSNSSNASAISSFMVTSADVGRKAPNGCILSTCVMVNLGSALQGGDEKAGSSSTDPFGMGRK